MKRHLTLTFFSVLLFLPAAFLFGAAPFDGVAFEAVSFSSDDPLMPDVQQRVDENVFKNLIAFPRAKMTVNEKVGRVACEFRLRFSFRPLPFFLWRCP